MSTIEFQHASCIYQGAAQPSVSSLDLRIEDGEFMVLVGPSGSGKSTALRMLAGLEPVSEGAILIDGVDVSQHAPKDRDLAMVFQSYALYPHMTVSENMAFALKLARVNAKEREERVKRAADLLDLADYLDRKPRALSGGQRQRVAMGRAIVREPKAFLMDEPLSNLDARLRVDTRANIAALQARLGTTTVYVTHDQVEAMTMGHRVAVLKEGVLQQVDTPQRLYSDPANMFVAGFIGSPSMNMRTASFDGRRAKIGETEFELPAAVAATAAARGLHSLKLGIRPETLSDLPGGEQQAELPLTVALVENLGSDLYVYGKLPSDGATERPLSVRLKSTVAPRAGDVIRLRASASEVHVFDPESELRLT